MPSCSFTLSFLQVESVKSFEVIWNHLISATFKHFDLWGNERISPPGGCSWYDTEGVPFWSQEEERKSLTAPISSGTSHTPEQASLLGWLSLKTTCLVLPRYILVETEVAVFSSILQVRKFHGTESSNDGPEHPWFYFIFKKIRYSVFILPLRRESQLARKLSF